MSGLPSCPYLCHVQVSPPSLCVTFYAFSELVMAASSSYIALRFVESFFAVCIVLKYLVISLLTLG